MKSPTFQKAIGNLEISARRSASTPTGINLLSVIKILRVLERLFTHAEDMEGAVTKIGDRLRRSTHPSDRQLADDLKQITDRYDSFKQTTSINEEKQHGSI